MRNVIKKENLPLLLALCVAFVVLVLHLTTSPLWYDEAVEYYYSKVMVGTVPGKDTVNMYERICVTFQPPLYNIVMYVWLLIYDSEWWFRLLGVIVTLVGSIGFYKSVKLLTNDVAWSAISALFYSLTPAIAQYALECAEYNLMLACVSWSLYYFSRSLQERTFRNYAMFCLYATLSVYSQYGAGIIEVVLFVVLFFVGVKRKDVKSIKQLSICAAITAIVAALPLLFLFLLPQLEHQGTTNISHSFYFAKGNIIIDMYRGLKTCVFSTCFKCHSRIVQSFLSIIFIIAMVGNILAKKTSARMLAYAALFVWLAYYFLVAISLYGHNSWSGKTGTENIGGRYSLFMFPLLILLIVVGLRWLPTFMTHRYGKLCKVAMSVIGIIWCTIFIYKTPHEKEARDNVRDVVEQWSSETEKTIPVYVHDWQYLTFMFYANHDNRYNDVLEGNIIKIYRPTQSCTEIEDRLNEAHALQHSSFYLVMSETNNNYADVLNVLTKHGFRYMVLHNGYTKMLFVEKL